MEVLPIVMDHHHCLDNHHRTHMVHRVVDRLTQVQLVLVEDSPSKEMELRRHRAAMVHQQLVEMATVHRAHLSHLAATALRPRRATLEARLRVRATLEINLLALEVKDLSHQRAMDHRLSVHLD